MMIRYHNFEDRTQLIKVLKDDLLGRFSLKTAQGERASWAVSGGSTPKHLFEAMQTTSLDWSKVDICLVDERWVPLGHARSNESFIRDILLKGTVAAANFTGMYKDDMSPNEAESVVEETYAMVTKPLTSVLLGMGTDGHTASLFPDAAGLERAFDIKRGAYCAAVKAVKSEVTGDEVDRMTLGARAIVDAEHVCLLLSGQEKMDVFQSALYDQNKPITRLIALLKKPIDVYFSP